MPKPIKSQWSFGELFPPAQTRKVVSVAELTGRIRQLLEKEVGQVWVSGEITNLRLQSSGHIYFTLKDAAAQLSCVLFRGAAQVDRSLLQYGRKVTLGGEITVYEPRGNYQLRVTAVELEGIGALQAAFERLKQKLSVEGLFAQERKRPLPRFPQRLGLVTSPTGAAIRDVLHVIERRNPGLEIVLAPCRVQGDGAAAEIAAGIQLLNRYHSQCQAESADGNVRGLDLILVTRGGGSLEDLWAFNEEVVARAIFESALPVVSAVGHEIDFTISDFVADVRAATPSVAAELITEGVFASAEFVFQACERLAFLAARALDEKREAWQQLNQRMARVHPRRKVEDHLQRLDDLASSLARCARVSLRDKTTRSRGLTDRLGRVRPALVLKQRRERLSTVQERLRLKMQQRMEAVQNRIKVVSARLKLLGPEQVLARGYSITADAETGAVLRDPAKARPRQLLKTRLHGGQILSRVEPE